MTELNHPTEWLLNLLEILDPFDLPQDSYRSLSELQGDFHEAFKDYLDGKEGLFSEILDEAKHLKGDSDSTLLAFSKDVIENLADTIEIDGRSFREVYPEIDDFFANISNREEDETSLENLLANPDGPFVTAGDNENSSDLESEIRLSLASHGYGSDHFDDWLSSIREADRVLAKSNDYGQSHQQLKRTGVIKSIRKWKRKLQLYVIYHTVDLFMET